MRILNLSTKQKFTTAILLYMLWVISFASISVIQEKEKLYKILDKQLEDAALITPFLLPKSLHHQNMQPDDLSKKQYRNTLLSLSNFTDNSNIKYIYTLILRDGKIFLSSSSATKEERLSGEDLSFYFDHYDGVDPRVFDIFRTKEKTFLEYTDHWGSFRSVFIPFYSEDGAFYLAAADLSISHIQALLNQQIFRSTVIALLFLLFAYPIYLTAIARIKNIAESLDNKVQAQTSELFQKEKRLNHALASANQGWFDVNIVTGEIHVSDELSKILGYDFSDVKIDFQQWKDSIHNDDKDSVLAALDKCLSSKGPVEGEYRFRVINDKWSWIHTVSEVIEWDEHDKPTRVIGIHRDITNQKRSEEILRLLAETVDTTQEGDIFKTIVRQLALLYDMRYAFIARINEQDNTQADIVALWANGEIGENFSYSLIGTPCAYVVNGDETIDFYPNSLQQQFPDDHILVEMEAESYLGVPLKNDAGIALGHIAVLDDKPMSDHLLASGLLKSLAVRANMELEHRASKKALEMMAHYDVLTQLPNRALFSDRFRQAVAHANRTETMLAICFLDLDGFKFINDNHGHKVGDRLLIEVAKRIKKTIREEDTASRQGGDEFALLLRDIESFSQCEQLLERIRQIVAQPYNIDDYSHRISVSIGTTIYPLDDADLDTLLRHADQAMYQAKLGGKNQQQLFNAISNQKLIQQQTKRQEIKQALTHKEFCLYYQPKVNMKTGQVFGAEALIRWIHPEHGLIPPLDFLPIIEGTDLEIQIGGWVINEALQQLNEWNQQGITLKVSINISSHHLQSAVFFDQLNDALNTYPNVDSQDLQLEILESSALGDLTTISGIIKSCQNVLGVDVALDDFGTGYSSLTHMKNLEAGTIKIDQSFVRDLLDDPHDYSIIEGIIGLAKAFDRDVIAEGVETDSHGLMLLIMGCHNAQGYGISRPITATDIPVWLTNYTPNQQWLDYAQQQFTPQQHLIILLQLTTEHWFNNINKLLLTMEDSGFGRLILKCHLGVWLSRFEEAQTFDKAWLQELKQVHDDLFTLANKLMKYHHDGDIERARIGINDLKIAYDKVSFLLEHKS